MILRTESKVIGEANIKRCAIYTRKSSSEGLDLSVNSLDAQRHCCESYVASQGGEGWITLSARYDDGGCSGGSLDRPAIQRLLADMAEGMVDVVIVYKIDRLSRSLIDFASLLGRFEKHGISFVAVTQAFNTTSSMGRLTLNVLLSFSQFERELASERLRDKFAAVRAQGLWQGGRRPFGYQVDAGVLTVDEAEAAIVRHMHLRYAVLGSARLIANELTARGVLNTTGKSFYANGVRRILKNRLYCGDLVHGGRPIPGKHRAIITEARWQATQEAIAFVARRHRSPSRLRIQNPLRSRIFGPKGELISLDRVRNRVGDIYHYYWPSGRPRKRAADHPNTRFRADAFDEAILSAIMDFVPLPARVTAQDQRPQLLKKLVHRIDIGEEDMLITLRSGAFVRAPITCRVRSFAKPRGSKLPVAATKPRAPMTS